MMLGLKSVFLVFFIGVTTATREYAHEGHEFLLDCEAEEDWDVSYWMLHDGGKIGGKAYTVGEYTEDSLEVFSNGTLKFNHVETYHAGTHLCVAEKPAPAFGIQEIKGYPIDMYVRPKTPDNLWEARYQTQFIIAIISALCMATLLGGSCLVHRYRWRPDDTAGLEVLVDDGHENPALEPEDVTVKM